MPNTATEIVTAAATEDESSADSFPTTPKDLSHVTLYFDLTPDDGEDSEFFFVKIETPDAVNDDFDTWYQDALDAIYVLNPELEQAVFKGAALKFGSDHGKSGGGEVYYANDFNPDPNDAPTGGLVQAQDYHSYGGGVEYSYGDLFS